jgi:hypothetical protein
MRAVAGHDVPHDTGGCLLQPCADTRCGALPDAAGCWGESKEAKGQIEREREREREIEDDRGRGGRQRERTTETVREEPGGAGRSR